MHIPQPLGLLRRILYNKHNNAHTSALFLPKFIVHLVIGMRHKN